MARRIGYTGLLLALYLAALILPRPAAAADPLPGDACTAGENAINTFQWNPTGDNGTPAAAGVTNAIFCIGNVRKSMMNFQAATGYVGIGNTAPGSMLDVGKAGTTLGTLRLEGNTSGYVQLQPAAAAGSWTATLPATAGTSGYVLSTDGAGVLSWISNAGTASTALSGLTNATAGKTLANANFAQVWNWDTLTTGTALTLGSTSMTTGHVLSVTTTNSAAVSGSPLLVNNSQTGANSDGIDVYSTKVGIWASATGSGGIGLYGSADVGAAIATYGVTASTTAAAAGVYGLATGATGATYAVYGQDRSNTGFGGYFTNTNGGYALVTGSGNVGIGTAAPATTLEVNGIVRSDATSGGSASAFQAVAASPTFAWDVSGQGADQKWWDANGQTTMLMFRALNDANSAATNWMQVNRGSGYTISSVTFPNGNVGIGTTAPTQPLEISSVGTATYGTAVQLDATAANGDGSARLILNNTGTGGHAYQIISTGNLNGPGVGALEFHDLTAVATRMILDSTGKLRIGNTAPSYALDVTGQVRISSFAAASATTVCSNAGVLSTCSSSIRYKEKVKDAPFGLKEVMLMRPVTFKWKGRDEKDLGFIAEEMEKVNPLFVNYARGQIEGVKYPQLTAVLASAIKEQQAQIKEQHDEIEQLRAEIESMKRGK